MLSAKMDCSSGETFYKFFSPRLIFSEFSGGSPAPTCSSYATSDQSLDEISLFDSRIKLEQTPSPCLSFKSDQSMGLPMKFSNKNLFPIKSRESSPSLSLDYQRWCLICKAVQKELVSIPCGHTFCKTCIQSWEKQSHLNNFSCPQCIKRFKTRPYMTKQARLRPAFPAQNYAGSGDVACDICTGKKVRAVKWCLTCSVAYCENHVRQHYTIEAFQRHVLRDVKEDLDTRACQLQLGSQEGFCNTDQLKILADLQYLAIQLQACNTEMKHLLKHKEELTAEVKSLKRAESELSHLTKRFCRGLQDAPNFTSDFVEVVALGRGLDLGMLYDCRSETFSPDSILWEKNLISTMKLSIPRPQSDVRVLDGDTLQDRLTALDLSVSLRASVVSGLVETTGASAFVHHPVQTELQDRVTLHCRTSTRLEMLSHELLQGRFPLPVTDLTTSTHVVVAVLYGTQAFFVFNSTKYENMDLKDLIKKTNTSSIKMDLLPRLIEKEKPTSFIDGNSLQSLVNGNPQNVKEVPLKVWLYPLKKFDQTLACALKDIRQDQLCKAENILEKLRTNISFSQYLMRLDGVHDVFTQFPALKDALLEFSLLLQHYQSNFMSRLASCIKNIRDTGSEVDEDNLQDLLKDNDQLPVELQCMHQWLQNKSAQVRALIQCRSANISILNNQNDLQNFVQDCQADKIVCFIFTSLEGEDPFLSALKRITESVNIQEEMKVSDTSQKSLWNLQSFILKKDTNESREETIFIAASVSDFLFPGSTIHLYQAGKLISRNVKLDTKPDPPEIIKVQQTRVMIKLQSLNPQTESYRVEYRAVREDKSPANIKWEVVSCAIDSCEISALAPGSNYQLRYAVMDSNEMTDYSRVLEIQTASRDRPGAPTVLKLNNDSLYIAWERPETDEDSRVVYYIVEYLEAGLEGWQSFQSDGPVCECRITLPYSTCYKARVSAVYINGDVSPPSKETKISARVWFIDLTKRKSSVFLDVLKLQTTKKSVKLRDCKDENSEVQTFLQCLSYISQLSVDPPQVCKESLHEWNNNVMSFLKNLCLQAAIHQREKVLETVQKLPSCYFKTYREQSAFLLDLYSRVKDYETQTGQMVGPALQAVYQDLPKVWSINLSERKASLFLEVLKLQSVKKPVELKGWSEEESDMRDFLHCLPYISQLSFIPHQPQRECTQERRQRVRKYLLDLCLQAALHQSEKIQLIMEKCFKTDKEKSHFLLSLHSHIRVYEARAGRSILSALQDVYRLCPKIWSINLSDKKASRFLEVLKLQQVRKEVKLTGWSEEESEMRILLQCLPYISQLRFGFIVHGKRKKEATLRFLVKLIAEVTEHCAETGENVADLLVSLCSFRTFSFSGEMQEFDSTDYCNLLLDLYLHAKDYEAKTCRSVLPTLRLLYESLSEIWTINLLDKKALPFLEMLKLQSVKKAVRLTGWSNEKMKVRSFVQCLHHISQLRLSSSTLVKMAQSKSLRSCSLVTLDELILTDIIARQPEETSSKVLTSLSFLLRHWKVKCLNLTEYKIADKTLINLFSHQGPQTVRFSEETLQNLVSVVYEAQDEKLTRRFLQNVDGDLTSCALSWNLIYWFLQHHALIVDFRRSTIQQENIQDLLPVLDKIHLRGLKSSFVLSIMRKLYETGSAHFVSSLLISTQKCINLENRKLSNLDCVALRFTLEHCTDVSLNLLWTSVPEGELQSILPLLSHVSHLRVDRLLLLRLLYCCSVPELQQEASVLLSALHHKLDFSCHEALDLTTDTTRNSLVLSREDCRVICMTFQSTHTLVQLIIQDCEIEEAGVEVLFPALRTVSLHCSKAVLSQCLSYVDLGTKEERVRRAMTLAQALGEEVDLSEIQLSPQICKSLALVLEYTESLTDLDLSHCQISDHELELLMPHLHKSCILDLSHNQITDASARKLCDVISVNSNVQTVCLFNNRITDSSLFIKDQRFEIW